MRVPLFLACTLTICCSLARADAPPMAVETIVEECYRPTDQAVVVPQRLELICKTGSDGPWGFSFAGFQTQWRGPLELEVTGSGAYAGHDVFSIAALALDFGNGKEWKQRALVGLGLIQGVRLPHPPGWGAGSSGKVALHGNLITAGEKPQRITIDPTKYAPADWDGHLWIGVMLHNVGPGKSLTVRIVNATPPGGRIAPQPDDNAKNELVRAHQRALLERAAAEMKQAAASRPPEEQIAPEMLPYAQANKANANGDDLMVAIPRAVENFDKTPLTPAAFMTLVERYFGWQHRAPAPSIVESLNSVLKAWKQDGEVGREIGCIVRTATNLEKIELTDVVRGRVIGKDSPPIELSAARGEYEGFQIILTALTGCSENVTIAMSELSNKDGGAIPASESTVNAVGYVRIFPGQPRQRLIPDPLLIGAIPPLKPGENQPVWVTLHVPDATPPGIYRGNVTIADGKSSIAVPVELKVRDFEIPKKISLRSSFWMFRDQINRFYHLDEVNFDDYLKWIDFALEHRMNPIDVWEGHCEALIDISTPAVKYGDPNWSAGTPNPHPDFTKWDKYLDRMIAGGANTLPLGTSHHFGSFFRGKSGDVGAPAHIERVKQAVKIMADHYKSRGIFDMHYLQLRDEVSDEPAVAVYRGVHDAFPDVKLLLTAMPPALKPLLQIPCPLSRAFDASWRDEVKAKGGEYWWYVCLDPEDPYANLLLHQQSSQHRALFWQTWSHDVDGLLYWGLNFWAWYDFKWPDGVGAQTTRIAREDWPAPISVPDHPGDGISMYPGPTPSQPMSSIRLECMRDGQEDYEYFVMLDAQIAKAQKAGRNDGALKQAIATRESAKKLVEHLTDYEKQPAPYLELRGKVADAIESLMR